jgi:hypothetical protein
MDSASLTSVSVGRYALDVGASAGTLIATGGQEGDPPVALVRALREKASRLVDRADTTTGRIEESSGLVRDVLDGALVDRERAIADADLLLGLFGKLVEEGRLAEAMRVARTATRALALLKRWAELLGVLRRTLAAAEQLGDKAAIAWVHHELGTLHLAAESHKAAQHHLEQARTLRRELGDEAGLAATEHNLGYLCRQLRNLLRDGRFVPPAWGRRRALLLTAVMTVCFFLVGAVAAAVVDHPHDRADLIAWVRGQGSVTSAPAGLECDRGRCEHAFTRGGTVTLVARPRHGSRFVRWTGDCHGHGPCRLVLDHAKAVAAQFKRLPHRAAAQPKKPRDPERKPPPRSTTPPPARITPPAKRSPAEQPPAERSPAEQPPADQPPADDPPVDQPPVDQLPSDTQPPADQPPSDTQPPVDQLPSDTQPPTDTQPPADQPPLVVK